MTRTLYSPADLLTPHNSPTPVERAVVDGIFDQHPDETFLWIVFHRPDGGAKVWYAWTTGGQPLGDQADTLALAGALDGADWFHILGRHLETTTRGRVEIQAHALRPILADIRSGERAPQDQRDKLARLIREAARMTGRTPNTLTPRWVGVGPRLLTGGAR
jgi:hypothetical protein